jgi:hypothetical protein
MEKRKRCLLNSGERHHIFPKGCGGNNLEENLVTLTLREHFIAHLLLVKMFPKCSPEWKKMVYALHMMMHTRDGIKIKSSRLYENARTNFINVLSEETIGEKNPFYGKTHEVHPRGMLNKNHSEESKKNISKKIKSIWGETAFRERMKNRKTNSESLRGYAQSEEHKENISKGLRKLHADPDYVSPNKGRVTSEETKKKLSKAGRGKVTSAETKNKLSERLKGRKFTKEHIENIKSMARKRKKAQCPHCGKIGDPSAMSRWHFDNCHQLKNS